MNKSFDTESTLEEVIHKAKDVVNRTFILGDAPNSDQIKEAVSERPLDGRALIKAGLALIYNNLSEDTKNKLHEKAFENLPLDIQKIGGYRVLNKIGFGGMNSVYLLSDGNEKSYSVSLYKRGFKDAASARSFVEEQKQEYEYFKDMYKEIPDLVQKESYVIYERHDGVPSVMFIREFIPGPLRDIFYTSKEELSRMFKGNQYLMDQLLKFTTISMQHKDVVLDKGLDLLGIDNLAIAGKVGEERLVFLDPHTIDIIGKRPELRQKICERLQYLQQIVEERTVGFRLSAYQNENQVV
jgi:hypothetical protein